MSAMVHSKETNSIDDYEMKINNEDECVGEIYQTKDYDKFCIRNKNRHINKNSVKRWKEVLRERNKLQVAPVIVNTEFEIVDGQHRFLAAKKLDLPICYTVDKDFEEKDLIILNTHTRPWKNLDFIDYFADQGFKAYTLIRQFIEATKCSPAVAIFWLELDHAPESSKEFKEKMKNGLLTTDKESLDDCQVDEYLAFREGMMDYGNQGAYASRVGRCTWAFKKLLDSDDVDNERLFKKLKSQPITLRAMSRIEEFLTWFIDIYNHHAHQKSKITYICDNGKASSIYIQKIY